MKILQFSVWRVKLEDKPTGHEQGGTRPVLLLLAHLNITKNHKTPIGFICSTSEKKINRDFSEKIEFKSSKKPSHVNITQIRTLDESRVLECIEEFLDYDFGIKVIAKYINQVIMSGNLNNNAFVSLLKAKNQDVRMQELKNKFG